MTWILALLGLLLTIAGLWGGPERTRRRREQEVAAARQPTVSEAWDILTRPLESEVIRIPEHRPWYMPGGDRRFQRGLAVGLGTGLMIASLAVAFVPREAPPQTAGKQTDTPTPGDGGGTAAPQPTAPATPTTPAADPPAPPKPANVLFTVAEGSLAPTIAADLKAQGLIASEEAFLARLQERELDILLKAGTFTIPTGADMDQVIDVLTQ